MKHVLSNVRIFAGPADLTGVSNTIEVSAEIDEQDVTSFASGGWNESLGGLGSVSLSAGGQWEAGDPGRVDNATWEQLTARTPVPWTVCPTGATLGALAYLTHGLRTSYTLGGDIGDTAPWEAEAAGSGALIRGTITHPPGTPVTADGATAPANLGELTAAAGVHATVHVLSIAGTAPQLTVALQSSADPSFAVPTVRAELAPFTDRGSGWLTVSGPVSDPWWRLSWTVLDDPAAGPSILLAVALGLT